MKKKLRKSKRSPEEPKNKPEPEEDEFDLSMESLAAQVYADLLERKKRNPDKNLKISKKTHDALMNL